MSFMPRGGGGTPPPSFDMMMGAQATRQGPQKPSKLKRSAKLDGERKINVQLAGFTEFEELEQSPDTTDFDTILNIRLEIRVELGRTQQTIQEVLDMGSGSVLELDKLNGEPVNLMVNKKSFAKGEMIVIGENFGVRVTDILSVP